eukprot:365255-Chlamydomonas_euryale.AAC.5
MEADPYSHRNSSCKSWPTASTPRANPSPPLSHPQPLVGSPLRPPVVPPRRPARFSRRAARAAQPECAPAPVRQRPQRTASAAGEAASGAVPRKQGSRTPAAALARKAGRRRRFFAHAHPTAHAALASACRHRAGCLVPVRAAHHACPTPAPSRSAKGSRAPPHLVRYAVQEQRDRAAVPIVSAHQRRTLELEALAALQEGALVGDGEKLRAGRKTRAFPARYRRQCKTPTVIGAAPAFLYRCHRPRRQTLLPRAALAARRLTRPHLRASRSREPGAQLGVRKPCS